MNFIQIDGSPLGQLQVKKEIKEFFEEDILISETIKGLSSSEEFGVVLEELEEKILQLNEEFNLSEEEKLLEKVEVLLKEEEVV